MALIISIFTSWRTKLWKWVLKHLSSVSSAETLIIHQGKHNARHVWYDWFCKDSALAGKTKKLGAKVCKIENSKRFNKETSYVFFKNNCPFVGALYDQFSICDIESGDVLYCCQHLEKVRMVVTKHIGSCMTLILVLKNQLLAGRGEK